jgi:multidrug efflux pump subunit AcrA (membrane-fusion protein)
LFYACPKKGSNDGEGVSRPVVSAVTVELKRYDNDLSSFGSIIYKTKNDITCQVEGTIIRLDIKEGVIVNKGEQIAQLRNVQLEIQKEQYENTLLSAKAALSVARTRLQEGRLNVEGRLLAVEKSRFNLEQLEFELREAVYIQKGKDELYRIGGITDAEFRGLELSVNSKRTGIAIIKKEIEISELGLRDEDLSNAGYIITNDVEKRKGDLIGLNTRAQTAELETALVNVGNAEKSLASIQKLLNELAIRATVTGVAGPLYFENGEYVPQNEKLVTIMDISTVYAVFPIQERDIINFTIGAPLEIAIPSLSKVIPAAIDEIAPVADPQSGNFSVKSELENPDISIRPGMFTKCVIPRSRDIIYPAIPETALVKTEGVEGTVYCVVNDMLVLKTVQIQARKEGIVWVAKGLQENERVVDKPSPFLKAKLDP